MGEKEKLSGCSGLIYTWLFPMFGPAASENGVTIMPEDSYLYEANAHGGSAEDGMKYVYLHSQSCLLPAVMWHVTHRMSVISSCCHLPVQTHLSRPAERGRNVCYVEQVTVTTQ